MISHFLTQKQVSLNLTAFSAHRLSIKVLDSTSSNLCISLNLPSLEKKTIFTPIRPSESMISETRSTRLLVFKLALNFEFKGEVLSTNHLKLNSHE